EFGRGILHDNHREAPSSAGPIAGLPDPGLPGSCKNLGSGTEGASFLTFQLTPKSATSKLARRATDYGLMIENAPILSCRHAGLTIEGYSRAAVQTYWRIPELKIGFDLGAHPWDFMGTPTWLVTHTHLDHVAALPVYVARRRMMRMEPPTLYLPAEGLEDVRRLLLIMQRLDRGRMICTLNGLRPGEEIGLSRELVVTAFATSHTIPSLGYLVWDR